MRGKMVFKEIWEFLGNKSEKTEEEFARYVFKLFTKALPWYYRNDKPIPFGYVYWWFSQRKLGDRGTAKRIIKIWEKQNLATLVPYHGIRLKQTEKVKP